MSRDIILSYITGRSYVESALGISWSLYSLGAVLITSELVLCHGHFTAWVPFISYLSLELVLCHGELERNVEVKGPGLRVSRDISLSYSSGRLYVESACLPCYYHPDETQCFFVKLPRQNKP